jgi:NADH-quinone oxidoreductase subunit G
MSVRSGCINGIRAGGGDRMTVQANKPAAGDLLPSDDFVTLTIDGIGVDVPPGTLVIRAAELIGISIPRFCDHPLLDPVGACRQCLVEVPDAGNGRPMPKPQASCTLPASQGMVVNTQLTSPVADKAQQGVMEMLLINHPLDCPVCDKGGECPLQNQAMTNGRGETRFNDQKRTFPKPINISAQVLLDRERCVLCARCTRFSSQIAGDPFIELIERGSLQQVGIYENAPFDSYFSGNTIQICPVGALTSAAYRFRARPFDLVSVPSVCEHCASGCALRTDFRRDKVMRRLAGDDPEVNEEWNCDKGRFAFTYPSQPDRLTHPQVRDDQTGELRPASWPEAFAVAARGLAAADGAAGVLTGGRLTAEDAYAYAKFARVALGTNDIDFRARQHSDEEAEFLASSVAGTGLGVTYHDLETAYTVVLAGFEPEDESPIVFLRLRKAVQKFGLQVRTIAPFTSPGTRKLGATLIACAPGAEAHALEELASDSSLGAETIILLGERLASIPGALSTASALGHRLGAKLAWIPRRAGERGAIEAGCLPGLLPGGRPVADPAARVDVAATWGVDRLPAGSGRDTSAMLSAAASGHLKALVVGGVDIADLPDARQGEDALSAADFVVSLELRASDVTSVADVVFPVASVAEKAGTFVDWEGRDRPFATVLRDTNALPDVRVLAGIAEEIGSPIGLHTPQEAAAELREIGGWDGEPAPAPQISLPAAETQPAGADHARLATWHSLIDGGRMLAGEPYLAATGRRPVVALSSNHAAALDLADNATVQVSTEHGSVTLPVEIADLVDGTVWIPQQVAHRQLRAPAGTVVRLEAGAS